jgi:hypothetical protein
MSQIHADGTLSHNVALMAELDIHSVNEINTAMMSPKMIASGFVV